MGDEGEPTVESAATKKRRRVLPERIDDGLAEGFARALSEPGPAWAPPPPRRPETPVGRWLKRGKIWDDVFTRTVANVLSLYILGATAAAFGLIQLDRKGWSFVALIGGTIISLIAVNVAPLRYLKHQWIRWGVFVLMLLTTIVVWGLIFAPFSTPSSPSDDCDVFFGTC